MWSLVFRLALMASTLIVAWNVARAWIAVLRAPHKPAELPADTPSGIAAKALAEEAIRHVTAIEVAIAELADDDLWKATERFTGAVRALIAAMLAEPQHHRRAKRHLKQILIAADQTTRHFARHYTATPDPGTRREFLDLAGELAEAYDRAAKSYASAGAEELRIEAETLKDLLRRAHRRDL